MKYGLTDLVPLGSQRVLHLLEAPRLYVDPVLVPRGLQHGPQALHLAAPPPVGLQRGRTKMTTTRQRVNYEGERIRATANLTSKQHMRHKSTKKLAAKKRHTMCTIPVRQEDEQDPPKSRQRRQEGAESGTDTQKPCQPAPYSRPTHAPTSPAYSLRRWVLLSFWLATGLFWMLLAFRA